MDNAAVIIKYKNTQHKVQGTEKYTKENKNKNVANTNTRNTDTSEGLTSILQKQKQAKAHRACRKPIPKFNC